MIIQSTKYPNQSALRPYMVIAAFVGCSLAVLLSSGCATQQPVVEIKKEEAPPALVWPSPPEQAVIEYVGFISKVRENEVEERPGFLDIVAGKQTQTVGVQLLSKPWGLSGDPQGRLLITDTALGALYVSNRNTGKTEQWGTTGVGKLIKPIDVTTDTKGNAYVVDTSLKRVVVFDSQGQYVNAFGGSSVFGNPAGIVINEDLGRIYVIDSKKHSILVFTMSGEQLLTIGKIGGGEGEFYYPSAIAIGPEGRLYVSDSMNFRVQILDADGAFINSFGKLGNNPGTLSRPKGIAVDTDGNIYVVDSAFSNIQIFNEEGQILLAFGEGGGNAGQFALPTGISIDDEGYIYISDQLNHRVQIFKYLGAPTIPSE